MHRRTLWGLFTAGLAFAFVTLMGQQSLSSNDLSDPAKRQNIESLYKKDQSQYPEMLDVTPQQAINLIADQKAVFIDIQQPEDYKAVW